MTAAAAYGVEPGIRQTGDRLFRGIEEARFLFRP